MPPIAVDTGPLVALCDRNDSAFASCREVLRRTPSIVPLTTTLAAVTEAMYLLEDVHGGAENLFDLLIGNRIRLDETPVSVLPRCRELMARYADLPMDFADATVVELAERIGADTVFSLDERDFRVYQPRHVRHFRLIPADL